MGAFRELLHPPGHRGPVIAAGAVVLTTGVALEQVRVDPGGGAQLLVAAVLAAVLLWLALGTRPAGGPPEAHESVLLVCGLLALAVGLLRLADVLGADFSGDTAPSGAFTWTFAVEALFAGWAAARRSSAVAALLAAVAGAGALLAGWDWVFDPEGVTPYRWLLLLVAVTCAMASLPLRAASPRHAVQMVNAAGLAVLAIPFLQVVEGGFFFGFDRLPTFWELVLVASGFGLIAYAAADGAPGPAAIGVAALALFIAFQTIAADETLHWWPLVLLVGGGALMALGLRPRAPLPPEPSGYRKDDVPLAARTDGDPIRVHRD